MVRILPNANRARIDQRKLRNYVLNLSHPTGRFKAAFFAQMGYTAINWRILERDILEQMLDQDAEPGQESQFGIKYTITAQLRGPTGETRWVTTVWILRSGFDYAELVTIEPARRRKVESDD